MARARIDWHIDLAEPRDDRLEIDAAKGWCRYHRIEKLIETSDQRRGIAGVGRRPDLPFMGGSHRYLGAGHAPPRTAPTPVSA